MLTGCVTVCTIETVTVLGASEVGGKVGSGTMEIVEATVVAGTTFDSGDLEPSHSVVPLLIM